MDDYKVFAKIQNLLGLLPPVVNDYYEEELKDKKELTALKYLSCINSFRESRYCSVLSDDFYKYVTSADIQGYIDASIGGNSIKASEYAAFNSFFTYLYNKDLIIRNPLAQVKRASTVNIQTKSMSLSLSCSDLVQLLENIKNSDDRWKLRNLAILYLILAEGLKVGTIVDLNISSYDYLKGELLLFDEFNNLTRKRLSISTRDAIEKWLDARKEYNVSSEIALFISSVRKRITTEGIRKIIRTSLTDARLDNNVSAENFRTIMATGFINIGYSVDYIKEYLGHKDSQATYKLMDTLQKNVNRDFIEEDKIAIANILGELEFDNSDNTISSNSMVSYDEYAALKKEYDELKEKYDALLLKVGLLILSSKD